MNNSNQNIPASKVCTGCDEDKPLENFANHKKGKYGKGQKCKPCTKVIDAKYYENNTEKIKTRMRTYQSKNPEKVKKSQHRSYMKRREETIKNNKEWTKNNRDKVRSYKRK